MMWCGRDKVEKEQLGLTMVVMFVCWIAGRLVRMRVRYYGTVGHNVRMPEYHSIEQYRQVKHELRAV